MDFVNWIYIVMFFFGIFLVFVFLILHKRNKKELFANPPVTKHYSVSFLVPAYNEEKSIRETVMALVNLDYPENKKEIIIINDGSKDKTLQIARELSRKYSSVKVLNKKNSGKADSMNQGIKLARGELIAVVDADSYPQKDALLKMVGHFDDRKVAAVTSRVLVKNKEGNWLSKFQVQDYSIIAWTRKLLDFVDSVYVTNGPLSVYRTDIVRKVGGFDAKNMTEDIELTWHLLSQGYQTKMSYSAIVYTTVPESFRIWIKQRVRWNLGGLQTLAKYWREVIKRGSFGWFVIPYVGLSFILALVGFILFARYLWTKGFLYFYSVMYSFKGYSLFKYISLDIYFSFLLFLGVFFFVLALFYYKTGFSSSETGKQSIFKILLYTFIYRPLYIIPLIVAIYKVIIGDIGWYTK